jgi:hypothetical protein
MYYQLVDVNPYHYNCGHYPQWEVRETQGPLPDPLPRTTRGTPLAYLERDEAEATAARLNAASRRAWREYLDA